MIDLKTEAKGIPLANAVRSLSCAVRAKDIYTAAHNRRVSHYATELARATGLGADSLAAIKMGGELHDVGKIGVADAVLLKSTRLTPAEFREIQRHSELGHTICKPLRLPPLVKSIIRHHHERLDGSGYPDGLKTTQIPLEVQIIALADLFDALRTSRVYRAALPWDQVAETIHDEATRGLHDRCLAEEFIRMTASWPAPGDPRKKGDILVF